MNVKVVLLFLSVFFTTLQAVYFREISLAPFPLLAFAFLFVLVSDLSLKKREVNFLTISYLITAISVVIGVLTREYLDDSSFYFPRILGWLIFPISVIYYRKAFNQFTVQEIDKVLTTVLVIHLIFFYVQYFSFTVLNYKIDYLVNLTGESQRTGAARLKEFGNSIRSSGLFTEPGSYSVYIYILISMKVLVSRKIDWSILAGIISMCFSFSMTGILMATCFLLYYFCFTPLTSVKIKNVLLTLSIIFLILLFKSEVFLGPIQERILNLDEDTSANARFKGGYEYFILNRFFYSGIGVGFLSESIQATSVLMAGLFDLGFILLSAFMIFQVVHIYRWSKSFSPIFLLLPVLLSNISFNQVIYTMIFAFLTIEFAKTKQLSV